MTIIFYMGINVELKYVARILNTITNINDEILPFHTVKKLFPFIFFLIFILF